MPILGVIVCQKMCLVTVNAENKPRLMVVQNEETSFMTQFSDVFGDD